MLTKTNTGSV